MEKILFYITANTYLLTEINVIESYCYQIQDAINCIF
jgi:hypothetical protein